MAAMGVQDYYREVPIAEDDEPDPADNAGIPSGDAAGDATEAATDALAASSADAGDDGSGLQKFRRRLHALSPDRPLRPAIPSAVAGAAQPPTTADTARPSERKPAVRTRRVMLSETEIVALSEYHMMTPEELTVAPKWQEMPPGMAKRMMSPSDLMRYEQALKQ